jgi:hypothetical protein
MDLKKAALVAGMVMFLFVLSPQAPTLAIEPPAPPPGAVIQGPELWGTLVVDCSTSRATLRVKKIENCDVDTQAIITNVNGCPDNERDILYFTLGTGTIFNINATPIIIKVKNFKIEAGGQAVSCDVQIKFWTNP